jgi:ribosome-binding protein aMBF1 (putative translation factor)
MAAERPSGEWRRRALAWYEMPTVHCELCGRPLTGRVWAVTGEGGERLYCGSDCELLARARGGAEHPERR